MEEEEDDDIYAPAEATNGVAQEPIAESTNEAKPAHANEELEDGEEEGEEVEEEESDSVYAIHQSITPLD